MNTRKGHLGPFEITNEEWECPYCNEWSNMVEWGLYGVLHKDGRGYTRKNTCPKCNSITIEQD